ncbi:MAG: hypothetical protein OXI67_19640 [Candidatus Poribacteria bacterium]|nr:hypothetical protein [Candidatus Poribacteria bacterium]
MIHGFFYTKWIIGGILLLIIIAGACYLWYQYDTAPYKQEAAEVAREWEAAQKAKANRKVKQAAEVSVEGTTQSAEKSINKLSTEVKNNTEAEGKQQVSDIPSEAAAKSDEKVSPHGFGAYPKVPADMPGWGEDPNFWNYPRTANSELMARVQIKLWEQGKRTHGATMENGLIYPTFPNTLIVKWKTQWTPFGTRKRASRISGSPETESFLRNNRGPIYENDIPSDIKVIEYKDAGIDPYTFLDLK